MPARLSCKLLVSILITSSVIILMHCNPDGAAKDPKAVSIIEKAIKAHGGQSYEKAHISFDFRDQHFNTKLNEGQYRYERTYTDSQGTITDVMTNDSAYRLINGESVALSGKEKARLKGALNSVNYFMLLPYHLNDEAVIPEYLGKVSIKDTLYHKVKVNFRKDGGGKDYRDTYVYWFQTNDYTMDYLAYRFYTNEGGIRFRKVTGRMKRGGITFQNYLNLAPSSKDIPLVEVDSFFKAGELEKVSEINKSNITVKEL